MENFERTESQLTMEESQSILRENDELLSQNAALTKKVSDLQSKNKNAKILEESLHENEVD